jgi:gas vesicle protein
MNMPRSSNTLPSGLLSSLSDLVFDNSSSKPIFEESTKSGSAGANRSGGALKQSPNQAYLSLANAGIKSSPVFFKVISTVHTAKGIGSLMEYLNKEETVELESSLGNSVLSKSDVKGMAEDWADSFVRESGVGAQQKRNHRYLYHTVISFPKDLNGEHALAITRNVMQAELGARGIDYLMAGHFNEEGHNPHVHIAFKTKKLDGTKLNINKEMIFNFRRAIAREAQNYGVNLHHGMSWERGMYSKGMTRAEYENGKSLEPKKLSKESKELLSDQISELKEHVLSATNRTKDADKIVFKQLRAIANNIEKSKGRTLNIEQDHGPEV